MKKADIDSILKENQFLRKRNQVLENLLQRETGSVPVPQEQIYRSLLHLCPASLAVTSLDDGVIYDVSDRFCRQSGFGREELIGRTTVEMGFWIAPHEERKKYRELLLRNGQCLNQEYRYRRRNGEVITGLSSAVLITIKKRRYVIVLVMDITDRKRAEEALIQDQVYMRSIIDSFPGVFYIVDQRGRYLIWNRNYEKVTGYSNEEISSMTVMDRTPVPDRKVVSEKMRYIFEQETHFEQYGLVCKNGTVKDYLFNFARMEYQGRLCLMVNGVDISEQKQTQDNLRRFAEDLEDANTALRVLMRGRDEEQKAIEEKL